MLSPEFVNAQELRIQIGALNKSGALKEKIKAVGVAKKQLVESFLKGVESIPEGSEEEAMIPPTVISFYNTIVEGTDPSDEEAQKIASAKSLGKGSSKTSKNPKAPKGFKIPRGPKGASTTNNEAKAFFIYKQLAEEGKADNQEELTKRLDAEFGPGYRSSGKEEAWIGKRLSIYGSIAKGHYKEMGQGMLNKFGYGTSGGNPAKEEPQAEPEQQQEEVA